MYPYQSYYLPNCSTEIKNHREYCMKINNSKSSPFSNIHGISQCYVLGPILFLIYIYLFIYLNQT